MSIKQKILTCYLDNFDYVKIERVSGYICIVGYVNIYYESMYHGFVITSWYD